MPTPSPRRTAAALAAALATAMLFPAAPHAQDTAAAAATTDEAPGIETVVTTVNGIDVTLGELILMRANLPEQFQSLPDERLFAALMEQATTQILLADLARKDGYDKHPLAIIRARVDARDYLAEARLRTILAEAATEDALRAEYEKRTADMTAVPQVRASHILVSDEELANDLVRQAQEGAEFAALAAEHGTDGTKAQGGDLGWFEREAMVAEFADAAFAAEEGVVVGPVKSQFGWHLILVTGKRDKPLPTYEEMQEELARDVATSAAQAAIAELRAGAEVVLAENLPAPAAIRRDDLLLPD